MEALCSAKYRSKTLRPEATGLDDSVVLEGSVYGHDGHALAGARRVNHQTVADVDAHMAGSPHQVARLGIVDLRAVGLEPTHAADSRYAAG